jgi:hypothetical protein
VGVQIEDKSKIHFLERGKECQGLPAKTINGRYVGTTRYLTFTTDLKNVSPHTAVRCDIYAEQGCKGDAIYRNKYHKGTVAEGYCREVSWNGLFLGSC